MGYKQETITILTALPSRAHKSLTTEVQAYVSADGVYAVHHTYRTWDGWTVTHVMSGYALASGFPKRKDAYRLVEQFQAAQIPLDALWEAVKDVPRNKASGVVKEQFLEVYLKGRDILADFKRQFPDLVVAM